jgi:ornithine cyclodeaminase/alanine dehydrogenase
MDCRWITAVRTGAVSAVAAKYLAKKDAGVIGIIGAGIQGRYNLLALKEVLPAAQEARIFDINPTALQEYVSSMSRILPFKVEACASPQDVIQGADVIVTATGKIDEPVYEESWVKPGALVLPVHHRGWQNATLHRVDKFIADDWEQLQQAHREVGGFYGPLPEHCTELGEVVTGKKPGRENEQERIIDFNYGLAIEDVAVAQQIYNRAKEKNFGTVLTLMEQDLPLPAECDS